MTDEERFELEARRHLSSLGLAAGASDINVQQAAAYGRLLAERDALQEAVAERDRLRRAILGIAQHAEGAIAHKVSVLMPNGDMTTMSAKGVAEHLARVLSDPTLYGEEG